MQNGLAITGSLTLAGWMKPESLPGQVYYILAGKYDYGSANRGYRLELQSGTQLGFVVSPDGSYSSNYILDATTPVTLTIGSWYHLAAVFDAAGRTMTLYLDGEPVGSRAVNHNSIYPSTAPFMMGANLNNGSPVQFFDGALDEWRVYARALSQAEIESLRNGPAGPQADFSAFPLAGEAPLLVQFLDNSTGATDYLWDFGDGITSTLPSPTHTYSLPGVYTMTQTVSNDFAGDSLTRPAYIEVLGADFGAGPAIGPAPLQVTFTNILTERVECRWWDFGDGTMPSNSSTISTTYNYTQPGIYSPTLTIIRGGYTYTATKSGGIVVLGAEFGASPRAGLSDLAVTFTDFITTPATYRAWNFGTVRPR